MSQDEPKHIGHRNEDTASVVGTYRPAVERDSKIERLVNIPPTTDRNHRVIVVLAAVGTAAIVAGVFLRPYRELLIVLGVVGLYGSGLAYYLPVNRAAESELTAHINTYQNRDRIELIHELNLSDITVYVPTDGGGRLYVPRTAEYTLPDSDKLDARRIIGDSSDVLGAVFRPSSLGLFDSLGSDSEVRVPDTASPEQLLATLGSLLVHEFGLAQRVDTNVDTASRTATVEVYDCPYDGVQFDHPVTSFLAVGLAFGLGRAVTAEQRTIDAKATTFEVTFQWDE